MRSLAIICLVATAGMSRADGASGAAILNVPLSVRQIGMGGVSAGGADVLRSWSNPALLAGQATRGEAAVGGASMFGGQQSTLGAGVGWMLTPAWALGAEVMSYSFGLAELDATGSAVGGSLERSVQSGGAVTAVRFGAVAVGVGLRGVSDALAGNAVTTVAADAGVSVEAGGFSAAAAVRNAGAGLRTAADSVPDGESLPREMRAGASYRSAPLRLTVGAEMAGAAGRDPVIGAGAEWWPAAALAIRAGVAVPDLQVSAGLSGVLNGYALDYAFTTHAIGATHRVSLSYAFGPTAQAFADRVHEAVVNAPTPPPVESAPVVVKPAIVAPAARPSGRSTLAVASFDPQNVSAGDAGVIADMFRSELVKQNGFDVVEKANMDKILMEQAFQQSGCTTAECAVKLGKVLNVHFLIVGSFGKLMDQYVLNFRVVETETAKVVYSDDARELSTQREVSKAIASMTTRLNRVLGSR